MERWIHKRRRGFMMLDVLAGLFLLAALATSLAVMVNAQQRTAAQLSSQRAAIQTAQEVLTNLQTAGQTTASDSAAQISVRRTGQRVGAMEWVSVTVVKDRRRAELFGLARVTPVEAK